MRVTSDADSTKPRRPSSSEEAAHLQVATPGRPRFRWRAVIHAGEKLDPAIFPSLRYTATAMASLLNTESPLPAVYFLCYALLVSARLQKLRRISTMAAQRLVFASKSERTNYYKLRRQWGKNYHIYPNLPFLLVFKQ